MHQVHQVSYCLAPCLLPRPTLSSSVDLGPLAVARSAILNKTKNWGVIFVSSACVKFATVDLNGESTYVVVDDMLHLLGYASPQGPDGSAAGGEGGEAGVEGGEAGCGGAQEPYFHRVECPVLARGLRLLHQETSRWRYRLSERSRPTSKRRQPKSKRPPSSKTRRTKLSCSFPPTRPRKPWLKLSWQGTHAG